MQVDYDGSASYSIIQFVPFIRNSDIDVALFPNPVNSGDVLYLQAGSDMEGKAEVSLIDLSGRLIFRDQVRLIENGVVALPIQNGIAPGHYTLSIVQGVRSSHSRLAIQ